MKKIMFLLMMIFPNVVFAQSASLNQAKYLATLQVVSKHKMNDDSVVSDVEKLRNNDRFQKELVKMVSKLDNSRPSEAKNRKIIKILERAGKEIYNELR